MSLSTPENGDDGSGKLNSDGGGVSAGASNWSIAGWMLLNGIPHPPTPPAPS